MISSREANGTTTTVEAYVNGLGMRAPKNQVSTVVSMVRKLI